LKVHFYGRLAQAIGPALEIHVPAGSSVAELRERLAAEFPQAAETLNNTRARACVANAIVGDDHRIAAGEELEFLPPVSGG
jgi:molybdopterin converting factor small subunit